MKLRHFLGIILFFLASCSSQKLPTHDPEYAISPLVFFQSTQSVVENYEASLEIYSEEEATYSVRKRTTVLDDEARDSGELELVYGGFLEILDVEGAIYSASGKLIRRIGIDDAKDLSLSGNNTLYQDTRIKRFELFYDEYPYTIVYDYQLKFNGLLSLPTFYPQNCNQLVESAKLQVKLPRDLTLNFRGINTANKPSRGIIGDDSVFTWKFKDLAPVENVPYSRPFGERVPKVLLAMESFTMGESSGSLESWNSFGKWYHTLSEGRDELPPETRKEISKIYQRSADKREAIRKLYEYMQNNTRYVSIQLGIGGWQPFSAGYVDENGYGDCKALTNYMKAILNHVGVEAYPVLINNGISHSDIVTDFPSNQFNHVILWVPEVDTIWLENTSQSLPFNYISYSNSNRHGLAVTPDSSFLIKTPVYDYQTNKLMNESEFVLDEKGNVTMDIRSSYSGFYLDQLFSHIAQKSDKDRRRWLHEYYSLNSFEVSSADFSDLDSRQLNPTLEVKIENNKYASRSGDRMFVPINKLNSFDITLAESSDERKEIVKLPYTFQEHDRTVIRLPDGYNIEAIPEPVQIQSDFGSFRLTVTKIDNEQIEVERILMVKKRTYPPHRYSELIQFFSVIKSSDHKNIVLIKS